MMHSNMVGESSGRGWKLLALILSAQNRSSDVETIVELASSEAEDMDNLELLRLKATLQMSQHQPRLAIETYGICLSRIQALRRCNSKIVLGQDLTHLEVEAWHYLTEIYANLDSWDDAEACVDKAKSIDTFDPRSWHAAGLLMQAKLEYKEVLLAFSVALSMKPEHVPSQVSLAEVLMELGSDSLPSSMSTSKRPMSSVHQLRLNHSFEPKFNLFSGWTW